MAIQTTSVSLSVVTPSPEVPQPVAGDDAEAHLRGMTMTASSMLLAHYAWLNVWHKQAPS